ncbi:MAG: hypothetical protein WC277_07540 [Bacilli bacterium]
MAINLFGLRIPQISLPSFPQIEVPKFEIPEITVPEFKLPEPPKITVPEFKLPEPPKITVPEFKLPEPPKITIPEFKLPEPAKPGGDSLEPPPGGDSLEPPPGGNIIDAMIAARDKSYEVGIEHIAAGNVAGGGTQFVATAGAEIMLPLDLMDAGNLWLTGRGDQVDPELLLWAGIDAISIAAIPFTFGASYAAVRAAKAGKVAAKTGGIMSKSKVISRVFGALSGSGKATTKGVTPLSYLKGYQGKTVSTGSDVSKRLHDMAQAQKAAEAAAIRRFAQMEERIGKSLSGLKPLEGAKLPGRTSKIGSALGGAAIASGATAIALTTLGVTGAPAPEEVPEVPELPEGGGGLPEGYDYSGGDDWWTEFINSLYGGTEYDPSLYEGYDPYTGYYDPGYPDVLGVEPYAQDLLTYAEGVPVVGGAATAAKQSGFALPILIGAVVLVVLGVAFLRSKKGKQMMSGAKKKVSKVTKDAKKAVGA